MRNILKTQDVVMQFGGVVAVDTLNIEVNEGEIVALIGPNGAGKTTAFNCITGEYTPTKGKVFYNLYEEGKPDGSPLDITGKTPDKITKLGVARTFQNIRLFKDLTVMDNILIAKHLRVDYGFLSAAFRLPKAIRGERKMREDCEELLERLGLTSVRDEIASSLPYGMQRHLEIARALATGPRLLLLDEPAAGMNPHETDELTAFIKTVKDDYHLTVFMIEHHMDLVMEISDRIYVLDFGQTIAHGMPDEIQNNDRVIEAYLGVPKDA